MVSTAVSRVNGVSTSVAVKAPVHAVATTNVVLNGLQTVGGVALDGDTLYRVLLTAQTDTIENGIWDADTGNWSRSADFDGTGDVVKGTIVVAPNSSPMYYYRVTSNDPVVPGTSTITFSTQTGLDTLVSDLANGVANLVGSTALKYKQTPAESAASVTPTNYYIPSHDFTGGLVYPERYGAKGDCTFAGTGTDDTTALTNANAVANAMPLKGTIWLQPKCYLTTNSFTLSPGVSLKSAASAWTTTAGTAFNEGAFIWKKHNNDAIIISGVGTEVDCISIQSNKATYATGDGFKVNAATTVKIRRCNARLVGGNSFVLGDNTTNSFTNSLEDCYSNNPGGANYVIGSQFSNIKNIQSDGGTIGVDFLVQSFGTTARDIHCEGFTSRFLRFNGGGSLKLSGWNYGFINDGVTVATFVEFTNSTFASQIEIGHIRLSQASRVAGTIGFTFGGVSDGAHNIKIDIANVETSNIDLAINYNGGNFVRFHHGTYDGCGTVLKQAADQLLFENNTTTNTSGTYVGNFVSGSLCRYRDNNLDKPLWSSGTLVNLTNKARGNAGWDTCTHGQTGNIASGTLINHNLPLAPDSVYLGARTVNAASDAYCSSITATQFAFSWAAGNTQYWWSARLACHED